MFFAVRLERRGPWDWSREVREQDGWEQHAGFTDGMLTVKSIEAWTILLDGRAA